MKTSIYLPNFHREYHRFSPLFKRLKKLSFFFTFFLFFGFLFLAAFLFKGQTVALVQPPPNTQNILSFKELLPTPALYPVTLNTYVFPEITATAGLVTDVDSMVNLYENNSELKVFPASTTKIMTGLIVLENYPLSDILTVFGTKVEGNLIGLEKGEQLSVESLLYGLLIASGNDTAQALAENFPGGVAGFVDEMNRKAQELSLKDTYFTNPIGYDEPGHYTTARDLKTLAMVAIRSEDFDRIVSTQLKEITDVTGEKKHLLKNTNLLIGKIDGVKGIKTGWTETAGECLVTLVDRSGKKVLIVVLGSKDRFGETEKIIDWVYNNFRWQNILNSTGL